MALIIDAILAGLAYGLGVTSYMWIYNGSVAKDVIGVICFSIIVMAIPFYKLDFFLGRPGILSNKNITFGENLVICMGNFIGLSWIGLFVKILPQYGAKIIFNANYALGFMRDYSIGTNFLLSMYAGMMFYAGAMAIRKGHTVFYFMLINLVCLFAQWPTMHFLVYCLWADTWKGSAYLLFPVVAGNILGANIWIMLRRFSNNFTNKDLVTPDEQDDIADRFEQIVLNKDYLKKNKDSSFDTSDEHDQDS